MARLRLEAAVAERDAQLDELGTSLRSAKEESKVLGEQVQSLSTKLSTMRRKERASSGSPAAGVSSGEGTPRREAERAAEAELTSEIATASAQRDALCQQCATLRATVEQLTAQMAGVAEEREAAAAALADSRVDAEDAQERAHELLEQLDTMQHQQIGTCHHMTRACTPTTGTTLPSRRRTGLSDGLRYAGLRGSDDGARGGGA
jgi:chromosome segregation ATPase